MSRAFVREPDGDEVADELPERQHSDLPNYITLEGLSGLQVRVRQLQNEVVALKGGESIDVKSRIATTQRDLRYLQERLRRAKPLTPPASPEKVEFGVSVKLVDKAGQEYHFTLVGEDETDLDHDRVSWASPVARLLTGCEVGDHVVWSRGETDIGLEVVEISV